jgi:hypothetical protein
MLRGLFRQVLDSRRLKGSDYFCAIAFHLQFYHQTNLLAEFGAHDNHFQDDGKFYEDMSRALRSAAQALRNAEVNDSLHRFH